MKTLFKIGNLIDGTGNSVKNISLLVENGKIIEIGAIPQAENAVIVDYSDKTVIPGLINAHVHLDMMAVADSFTTMRDMNDVDRTMVCLEHMEQYLSTGVTYVRSLGVNNDVDIKLRNFGRKNNKLWPGIVAAGTSICITGGHGWRSGGECDGEDECRKMAREIVKRGADCVKFMATGGVMTPNVEPGSQQLTYEEMLVICKEAAKAGKTTATHAQGTGGIYDAVRAGVTSVEHGIYLTDEIIDMMLERGTALVATLSAPYNIAKYGLESGIPAYAVEKTKRVIDAHNESFRKAYKAGVFMAVGTDAGTPMNAHDKTWVELKLMCDNGVKPMEAITFATQNCAKLLRIDNLYGTLEAGKMADLVVLDACPLDNIENLSKINAVYKHGQLAFGGKALNLK